MCIRRKTREKARPSLAFPPVSKPHTHITYMLRQCTSIVYWGGRIMYYHRSCEIFLFWRYPKRRGIYWLVEILSVDICNSLLFDLNGFFNKIMVITCYSNITSFFRLTGFPVVNVHVDELSSARIWQHKLCATLSANVNINCRLPIKVYYRICTKT